MSNSYRNFSTNLERKKIKKRHEERRDWRELQERLEREEWLKERKLRDYLREKGELDE